MGAKSLKEKLGAQFEHTGIIGARDLAESVSLIKNRAEDAILGAAACVEPTWLGMVERVEGLKAQLKAHALRKREGFVQRCCEVHTSRSDHCVLASVAETHAGSALPYHSLV